jgi:hypothetical protein
MYILRRLSLFAMCWFVGLVIFPAQNVAHAQIAVQVFERSEIPRDYKSWSLFLVCNPGWLSADKPQDVSTLYERFTGFGRTIGDDNAAVWFWKKTSYTISAENVDVERSIRFCRAYGLKPSLSPYVLVTTKYPDEAAPKSKGDFAVFQLGGVSPTEVSRILAKLTDDLLLRGKVQTPAPVSPPSIFVRILEIIQANNRDLGCRWNLTIHAAFLTAAAAPCK